MKKSKEVKPVFLGTGGDNVMRGRDVRQMLIGKNVEPTVQTILERIAEINHINMKAIAELASMQEQTVNLLQNFSDVAGNMKERTDQMARAMGEGSEEPDETTKH